MQSDVCHITGLGLQAIADKFQDFIHAHKQFDNHKTEVVVYAMLKTQGQLLCELLDFDRAIKCQKSLRNFCRTWHNLQYEIWALESLALSYKLAQKHGDSAYYLHKALELCWEIGDTQSESRIYESLATAYFYEGELSKSKYFLMMHTDNNCTELTKQSQ